MLPRCMLLTVLWQGMDLTPVMAIGILAGPDSAPPQTVPVGSLSATGSLLAKDSSNRSEYNRVIPESGGSTSEILRGNGVTGGTIHTPAVQHGTTEGSSIPWPDLGEDDRPASRIGEYLPTLAAEDQRHRRLPLAKDDGLDECKVFTNFSDFNSDGNLDRNEYVVLVNLLMDDGDPVGSFDALPISLQDTFDALALGNNKEIALLEAEEEDDEVGSATSLSHPMNLFQHESSQHHGISFERLCSDTMRSISTELAVLVSDANYLNTRQIDLPGLPGQTDRTTAPTVSPGTEGDGTCEFLVNFDVQIQYAEDEFLACDSSAQDQSIGQIMVDAMSMFAATEGSALTLNYNPLLFWDDQEINNLEPFRRTLMQRELQSATCSARQESESCPPEEADYCRWGCLVAEANCAEVTIETFKQMADDVTESLKAKAAADEIDCLGIFEDLMVNIRAEGLAILDPGTTSPSLDTSAPTNLQAVNTTAPTDSQGIGTIAPTDSDSQGIDTTAPTDSQGIDTTAPTAPTSIPSFENTSQATFLPQTTAPTATPTQVANVTVAPTTISPVTQQPILSPQPTSRPQTSQPSLAPVIVQTPRPTFAPNATREIVTGHNSWIMSNSIGLTAEDMTGDQTGFVEIRRAYRAFTADIVSGMSVSRPARSMLRHRRRLEVTLQSGSSDVYRFVDSACPSSAAENDNCLTAFGQVDFMVVGEDPDQVYNEYVDTSQIAIDSGLLQESLNEVAAGSLWAVEQSSVPVTPSVDVEPPIEEDKDRGGTDLVLGLIASGAVAIVLVIIVCLFVILPQLRKNRGTKQAKKEALEALREAEARDRAAAEKMAQSFVESVKPKKRCKPPKTLHDEGDNPYREEVEQLINENCPDLIAELDSLLHQFQGREKDLIALLRDFKTESLLDEDSLVDLSWDSDSLLSSVVAEVPPIDEVEMEAANKAIVAETVDQDEDDEEFESEESSKGSDVEEENRALEPPESSDTPLEPPELKAIPSEESFESESEPELDLKPAPKPESIVAQPEPEQPKKTPSIEEDDTSTTDENQTMESDFLSTSSDESSVGYQIVWVKRDGYWMKKRVWPDDQWNDETEYDSSDDESETQHQFRWVKNVATNKFAKEDITEDRMLLDDDSSIGSNSSESDVETPKFILKNGQWVEAVTVGYGNVTSPAYSMG